MADVAQRPLLLVEDGLLVLLTTQSVLEDDGYAVVAAPQADQAIDALEQPFAALITDIRLPGGVDGFEVARIARDRWPDLPVVYTSGDFQDGWEERAVPGSVILRKPYTGHSLLKALSEVLLPLTSAMRRPRPEPNRS